MSGTTASTLSRMERGQIGRPDPDLCALLERLSGGQVRKDDLMFAVTSRVTAP